jgi:acyl-CoA thioesterase-1
MWRKLATLALFFVIPGLAACGGAAEAPSPREATAAPVENTAPAPAPVAADSPAPAETGPLVIFLGDSLTAGLGLPEEQAYPALLDRRLDANGAPVRVLNAGVSGDTTAGGLARLDWLLKQKPDILVLGLGGNDGLRGLELGQTEKNLREIVRRSQAAGVRVLLLGMMIPPNYGAEYTERFRAMYPKIAEDLDVPLVPFLLEGVGGIAEFNQEDGIHPTAKGQEIVANNVEPYLMEIVEEETAVARTAAAM